LDLSLLNILILLAAGLGTGLVAGFAGVGGGIVMVPVMLELLRAWGLPREHVVQAAMATSLTVSVLSTGSSAWRHHRQQRVLWRLVVPIVPASMLGGWLGSALAAQTDGRWLQTGLACVLLFAAYRLVRQSEPADGDGRPRRSLMLWGVIGLGTGLFAGLSGLAGGVVLVPSLALFGKLPGRFLAATSSGVIMFTSLAASLGYMWHGPPAGTLGDGFVGYANVLAAACLAATAIPLAQVGAKLNKRTSGVWFRRLFAVLMVIVVVRLLTTLG
jgi:uncharacterized membrane protein YfcA